MQRVFDPSTGVLVPRGTHARGIESMYEHTWEMLLGFNDGLLVKGLFAGRYAVIGIFEDFLGTF
jgi:hypothetical protein